MVQNLLHESIVAHAYLDAEMGVALTDISTLHSDGMIVKYDPSCFLNCEIFQRKSLFFRALFHSWNGCQGQNKRAVENSSRTS